MSSWLLVAVSALYLIAGVSLLIEGKTGLSLFCLGCVMANLGLMIAARG